jgi:hypothetical protein
MIDVAYECFTQLEYNMTNAIFSSFFLLMNEEIESEFSEQTKEKYKTLMKYFYIGAEASSNYNKLIRNDDRLKIVQFPAKLCAELQRITDYKFKEEPTLENCTNFLRQKNGIVDIYDVYRQLQQPNPPKDKVDRIIYHYCLHISENLFYQPVQPLQKGNGVAERGWSSAVARPARHKDHFHIPRRKRYLGRSGYYFSMLPRYRKVIYGGFRLLHQYFFPGHKSVATKE